MYNITLKRIPGRGIIGFFLFSTIFHVNLYAQNLLDGPNDIVFDEANNRYLVANWAGNSIIAVDLDGNQQMFKNNVPHAHGLECRDSVLYVASDHSLVLINLSTAEVIENINVPESQNLSHVTLDSSHFVYMTDWSARKLFRIDLNNKTSMSLCSFDAIPGGVFYDENYNRLIILTFVDNAPIHGYDISTGDLFTIANTNINEHVAICRDANSNYYITSFSDNMIHKFGNDFSTGSEIISTGHSSPSGLGYNRRDHTIGVTNYDSDSIDLIPLEPNDIKYELEIKPADYMLFQNYPNPFKSLTRITYSISKSDYVTLKIYNILGREIQTLVDEFQNADYYSIYYNSSELINGIYFYKLQIGNKYVEIKKMLFVQ